MKILKIATFNNEKGSAIIVALLMGLSLSLAVFMAVDNSMSNNRMMRGNRQYRDTVVIAVAESRTP